MRANKQTHCGDSVVHVKVCKHSFINNSLIIHTDCLHFYLFNSVSGTRVTADPKIQTFVVTEALVKVTEMYLLNLVYMSHFVCPSASITLVVTFVLVFLEDISVQVKRVYNMCPKVGNLSPNLAVFTQVKARGL